MADLAEERPRASNGDAKVVKKFAVDAGAQTRLVAFQHVEERRMNLPRPDVCPNRRKKIHAGQRAVITHRDPNPSEHHPQRAFRTELETGPTFDYRYETPVRVFVAAQARQCDQ